MAGSDGDRIAVRTARLMSSARALAEVSPCNRPGSHVSTHWCAARGRRLGKTCQLTSTYMPGQVRAAEPIHPGISYTVLCADAAGATEGFRKQDLRRTKGKAHLGGHRLHNVLPIDVLSRREGQVFEVPGVLLNALQADAVIRALQRCTQKGGRQARWVGRTR